LSGKWEFATGNDPRWEADSIADQKLFHPIQVPTYWDNVGYKNYDGHAWYRKTFGPLPVSGNETLILFLGKIDDTDVVFLNGARIGDSGHYDINRRYEFSSDLLKETNTLAVHVYDGQQGGGIYAGPIGIMKKTDFVEYQKRAKEQKKWHLDKWRLGGTIDWLLGRNQG
jgi:sialate O-acetylesterase